MKIVKENYENFIKRENINIDSPLALGIKNGEISYYEIINDENNYVNNFKVFDLDNNWLAIDVHNKNSILDNEEIMKLILSEMKKKYTCLILRVDEEFKERIEKAKEYGFVENCVKTQGNYNYIELKIEFWCYNC